MRVLGLGDNVVDKYMHIMVMYPGGNALNFAVYGKMMGAEAAYMGNFGDDEEARHVHETIAKLGLDISHCRFLKGENGAARVTLIEGDRVFLGSNQGGVSAQYPPVLSRLDLEYIHSFDLVHTSKFSHLEDQMPQLREAARFLSMDFSNSYTEEYLKEYCPYVDCACVSCGEESQEEDVTRRIETIVDYGCRHVVIATRGAKGSYVWVDGKIYRQSPCLVKAKDTMGAGDSFITSFLVNYVGGLEYAVDFPEISDMAGVTTAEGYRDLLVKTSLYKAAVFSSRNCLRDGSFGYGKAFSE